MVLVFRKEKNCHIPQREKLRILPYSAKRKTAVFLFEKIFRKSFSLCGIGFSLCGMCHGSFSLCGICHGIGIPQREKLPMNTHMYVSTFAYTSAHLDIRTVFSAKRKTADEYTLVRKYICICECTFVYTYCIFCQEKNCR